MNKRKREDIICSENDLIIPQRQKKIDTGGDFYSVSDLPSIFNIIANDEPLILLSPMDSCDFTFSLFWSSLEKQLIQSDTNHFLIPCTLTISLIVENKYDCALIKIGNESRRNTHKIYTHDIFDKFIMSQRTQGTHINVTSLLIQSYNKSIY